MLTNNVVSFEQLGSERPKLCGDLNEEPQPTFLQRNDKMIPEISPKPILLKDLGFRFVEIHLQGSSPLARGYLSPFT